MRNAATRSVPALDIDIESLVTEDDTPVDNMPSEKQAIHVDRGIALG